MIHTSIIRNCVVFLLPRRQTRSATLYGSQVFDYHKWPTVLVRKAALWNWALPRTHVDLPMATKLPSLHFKSRITFPVDWTLNSSRSKGWSKNPAVGYRSLDCPLDGMRGPEHVAVLSGADPDPAKHMFMNNNNFVIFFTQYHFKTGNNILYMFQIIELKTLDTFSYCQRLFFSVGVSQHYALDNKPVKKLNSIGRRSCEIINIFVTQSCVLSNT